MSHSICITYNYCQEDSTAWIMNFHENRRAA